RSLTPPFEIKDGIDTNYDTRMKYRYLDLRRPEMTRNIRLRHQVTTAVRSFFNENEFIEIETPFLGKSTPEGARDYLVASRRQAGEFYALPQSPQINKQLLMNAGFDRYYQIVKCFRDEDLRGDRQPEFTQIDVETAFIGEEEIQTLAEGMLKRVMKESKGIDIVTPFPRMDYQEAMARYGSDKPDTRFEMELIDLSDLAKSMDFPMFNAILELDGQVKAINVKGAADKYSRADLDKLAKHSEQYGAKNLPWLKVTADSITGSLAKAFDESSRAQLLEKMQAQSGDLILFSVASKQVAAATLGAMRNRFAKEMNLIDESKFNFLWIVNFPMFEWSEEEGRYMSSHHPFTLPFEEDMEKIESKDLETVRAHAYDIVLNGYEIGGGSLRIHDPKMQAMMFEALGFSQEQAMSQFGFLINSMEYGYPPEGGLAFGLDRIIMLLAGTDNIRDVIAFPKNAKAIDPMSQAPSQVSKNQLEELSLLVAASKED
ncbi:MAG: aspartate--tRNA ligase, partial [Lactovum sp.]